MKNDEIKFFKDKVELLEHRTFYRDFDQKGYISCYYGFVPNATVDNMSIRELAAYLEGRIEVIESLNKGRMRFTDDPLPSIFWYDNEEE